MKIFLWLTLTALSLNIFAFDPLTLAGKYSTQEEICDVKSEVIIEHLLEKNQLKVTQIFSEEPDRSSYFLFDLKEVGDRWQQDSIRKDGILIKSLDCGFWGCGFVKWKKRWAFKVKKDTIYFYDEGTTCPLKKI